MTNTGRGPRLAQKAKPRRLITEISFTGKFQCHWAVQIYLDILVGVPHPTATQLDWFPIFARHQFIMLKALQRLYWCRFGRFGERRQQERVLVDKIKQMERFRALYFCEGKSRPS